MPPAVSRLVVAAAACAMGLLTGCAPDFGCGGLQDYCEVEGGRYLALAPRDLSEEEPAPVFIHYHGHRGNAQLLYEKDSFTEPMLASGALAIYVDSDGGWGYSGGRDRGRDEIAFFDAILDDVLERFPVDRQAVIVSGYSVGGSMTWEVACHRGGGDGIVFAPVSGAFWDPLPQRCDGGPVRLRHEHGLNDPTFPLEGRAVGDGERRQGDVRASIQIAAEASSCGEASRTVEEEGRTCEVHSDCATGGEVWFCLHERGHYVTEGWHTRTIDWAREVNAP